MTERMIIIMTSDLKEEEEDYILLREKAGKPLQSLPFFLSFLTAEPWCSGDAMLQIAHLKTSGKTPWTMDMIHDIHVPHKPEPHHCWCCIRIMTENCT